VNLVLSEMELDKEPFIHDQDAASSKACAGSRLLSESTTPYM
jgi:hypothetical protein